MSEFLATIAEHTRNQVKVRRKQEPVSALQDRPLFHVPTRGFASALKGGRRRIIAEIKRASPSKGIICENFDAVAIAREYSHYGASAISVLTEKRFFHGSLSDLERVHQAVNVPLLRKDFIIDPYQLIEAKSFGADAVLLIAALLDSHLMRDLRQQAVSLSLDTLLEVHTEAELTVAASAGADLIGINNRDLKTFEVDLAITKNLAPLVASRTPVVCESGIETLEQIRQVETWGIHIFLIGESLMRTSDPGRKLAELLSG